MNIASVLESVVALFWVGIGIYILYKTPEIPALGRFRQEDPEWQASLRRSEHPV